VLFFPPLLQISLKSLKYGQNNGLKFLMIQKIRIIFSIPELRQKILLTLGLLASTASVGGFRCPSSMSKR